MPLFDFTSEPALQALQIMKKMLDLSSANALQPGATDGGVNQTPDEIAFAQESVAYYIKYQNAPLRFEEVLEGPERTFRMGALPKAKGGEGATVFWTTGACLFKYGKNKEKAAEYMKALTYEPQIWKDSIAGTCVRSAGPVAAVPVGLRTAGRRTTPDWLQAQTWVPLVLGQLGSGQGHPEPCVRPARSSRSASPIWEKYLKGEEKDPKVAMQAAKDAVVAEIKKTGAL